MFSIHITDESFLQMLYNTVWWKNSVLNWNYIEFKKDILSHKAPSVGLVNAFFYCRCYLNKKLPCLLEYLYNDVTSSHIMDWFLGMICFSMKSQLFAKRKLELAVKRNFNALFKMNCFSCDTTYLGETSQYLRKS